MIYDVIVVGGGPSGAMAAQTCAENGLNVILFEKEALPRYKTCGGAVSKKVLDLIGGLDGLEPHFKLYGARTFTPKLESLIHKFDDLSIILTFRDSFDYFLLEKARSKNVKICENERVEKIERHEEYVKVTTSKSSYFAKILIGADGVNGLVAKQTNLRKNWGKDKSGICIEAEIQLDSKGIEEYVFDPQLVDFYFIENWGYGWVFPKGNVLSVGIGGMRERVPDPLGSFSSFLHLLSKGKSSNLENNIISKKAHLIPAGGLDRNIYTDRVMLVGDAAGFVDPFIGEGIYYSILSGIIAGKVATEAINDNNCLHDYLSIYEKRCDREFNNDLKFAYKFAKIAYNNLSLFMLCLKADHVLYKNYLLAARGEYTYKQYVTMSLKRFPITLMKIVSSTFRSN